MHACQHHEGTTSHVTWPSLRTYPKEFGIKIKELLPCLKGGGGKPELVDFQESHAYTAFEGLPCSTWSEAKLVPVLRYVRMNKHLNLIPEWKAVLPKPFEILKNIEDGQNAAA